ncbi:MAG: LysR family transcriptional regulator [Phycisphaerales bacterium]|nr:LysR family transcriptional regulator [Phycisphaerales bacterium]
MDIRDIRAFVLAGELLHFGKAADRMHVTQSALSKQIHRLESEIGGALFERNTTRTKLTPLGRALHNDARMVVDVMVRFTERAKNAATGILGTLRIGFGDAAKIAAPIAISHFRELRPDVQIELYELSAHHQIEALKEGTLDVGFCRLIEPKGWPTLPIIRTGLVAVLPTSYPEGILLTELGNRPLATIMRSRAPAFHDHVINYLLQLGIHIQSLQTVSHFSTAVALADAGVAWAIVPSSTSFEYVRARIMPIDDERAQWDIGLVRPPGEPGVLVDLFWSMVAKLRAENEFLHA